jgi:Transmembrane domain of unknown function (DUF3566)
VTAPDGIGRSTPSSDLPDDATVSLDSPVDTRPTNGAAGNGSPRYSAAPPGAAGTHASSKASTAYEVAAALRAQASRAAQATRDAGRRVQDALSTQADPGAVVANSAATKPADAPTAAAAVVAAAAPAPAARRHGPARPSMPSPAGGNASAGGNAPIGAAAAIAATAPPPPAPPRPRSTNSPSAASTYPAESAVPTYPAEAEPEPDYLVDPEPADRPVVDPAEADRPESALAPAPVADPLAPVVAPVVVPPEPVPLTRGGELVEPAQTHASLQARPDATQLAPHPMPRPATSIRRSGRVRKARLRLLRVDPWSVMKTAFLLSVALGITLFVAVAVLWSVLDAAGVFTAVGDLVRDLTSSETNSGFQLENYTALSRVLGFTTLIAVVDVVLVTALATLGAFLYNLSASLLGGLEVTLAEDD